MRALILTAILAGSGTGTHHQSGIRQKPRLAIPYYLNQPPIGAHISTIHMPDNGTLDLLTYDVNNVGTGSGVMEVAITRGLPDGGVESLCQVNVECTSPAQSHLHPDAGTCGGVLVEQGQHLKLDVLSSGCGTKPDGFVTGYFTIQ